MSGEVQPRKRKDKKKKKLEDSARLDDAFQERSVNDKGDEDLSYRDDSEDRGHADDHSHHGSSASALAKFVFFLLFAALLIAMGSIFFQLKGSEIADTPIKESRYASIFQNFIEEHAADDHDDDHGAEDHGVPAKDDHDDSRESQAAEKEDISDKQHEPPPEVVEPILLEPSMPEHIEIPEPETSDESEDEELEEQYDEIQDEGVDEGEEEPVFEEIARSEEDQSSRTEETEREEVEQSQQDSDIGTEHVPHVEEVLKEEHPNEEIPHLVEQETHKEYIKIIDDVLREHHQQQKLESGGKSAYPAASITNDYDYEIRHEIDEANKVLTKAPDKAYSKFSSILEMHPKSPRALYGKAMAMDRLSEIHKNNAILEQSIYSYRDVLDLPDVPDELFKMSAFRCVDRMRFRGFQLKALKVLDRMLLRFPNNAEILNQKAVTYLLMGKNKNAKETLEEILKLHPNNGFAKVHYGFILKIEENDNKMAIKYLQEGIATQEPGTNDGRFYFHLGDALVRENRSKEAYDVYDAGVQKGLFLSKYQRSLYNVKSLKAIPWWSHEQTTYQHYLRILEENWLVIRAEAIPLISDENQGYFPENEGLRNKGQWKQFEMFARGSKITQNCNRTPKTCKLIESIPAAADCKRGQVKFSLMYPGTRVWPHTGPTNCRLRAHLGLVIPEGAGIRVANETRKWKEGRIMVFDDSFEHEVWHEGTSYRLILIVDFWHPDLTEAQKQSLTSI